MPGTTNQHIQCVEPASLTRPGRVPGYRKKMARVAYPELSCDLVFRIITVMNILAVGELNDKGVKR